MKNIIKYYYNIQVNDIRQNKNHFYFNYNNQKFVFYKYERDIDELYELYLVDKLLINQGYPYHMIILNKNGGIYTHVKENNYVLMKYENNLDKLCFDEIIEKNIYLNNYKFEKIQRNNWYDLWCKKIDHIEYVFNNAKKKDKFINESINYYIGLAESAIILSKMKVNTINTISKRTMTKQLFEYFNPLNIIIDDPTRDISEYYKFLIINEGTSNETNIIKLEKKIKNLSGEMLLNFFIRLLFPNFYFDTVEKILKGENDENQIKQIISKQKNYEQNLQRIYMILSNKKQINIEWLNKKSGINPH